MKKEEMVTLLRSVGVEEKIITAMESAWDVGYDYGEIVGYNKHLQNLKIIGEKDESKRD
jgi:hypothetical protein